MASHTFPANLKPAKTSDDPPPPYSTDNEPASVQGEKGVHRIPGGCWDLACNIGVEGPLLQLNRFNEPKWAQDVSAVGERLYRRDGFGVTLWLSHIRVKHEAREWLCDGNSYAGQLLMSGRNTISLRQLGERLLIFERTIMTNDRDRPPPKPRDDFKGCLKIERVGPDNWSDIWTITGTDIYQVEGYENDVVVRSPRFLRLWDMAKGRLRWEREGSSSGCIWGFSEKFIIVKVGYCHLYERRNGNVYGNFDLVHHQAFIDFNLDNHFGPVMTLGGLVFYKPCQKAIFIFQIRNNEVDVRIWESTDVIQGALLLRGNLENLELKILGQKHEWRKYEEKVRIYKNGPIKKRLL